MFRKQEAEVLVVGAGPVGLMTALALVERGVPVEVVDQEQRTGAHNYALALHPGCLRLLKDLGVWSELQARGRRVDVVGLYDGATKRAEMRLAELGGDSPHLLVLPQSALEDVLEHRLHHKGVDVLWNHRVSQVDLGGNRVAVEVEKLGMDSGGYPIASTVWMVEKTLRREVAAVVGADGHHSVVRRRLDIPFDRVGEPLAFAVAELDADTELGKEVRVVVDADTTNVVWPLPGKRCRLSFQITEADIPGLQSPQARLAVRIGERSFPFIPEAQFQEITKQRAPWFAGRMSSAQWSMAVRFERGMVQRFGQDRAWLVGDAAHMTAPAGGHSMNVGLLEAVDLATRMAKVLRGGGSWDSLQSYNQERLKEWRMLLGLSGPPVVLDRALPWVAQNAARLLPCIPASGDDLTKLMGQLGLALPGTTR